MLRNVGILSFLIGVLVLGASAGLYMITMQDCQEERAKQEAMITISQIALDAGKKGLELMEAKPYKTEADLQIENEFSRRVIEYEQKITFANHELGKLVRRERQAKRFLFLGIGVGLYLCILQTPFLIIAGRQN